MRLRGSPGTRTCGWPGAGALFLVLVTLLTLSAFARAQSNANPGAAPAAAPTATPPPEDPLGRDTPRGAVVRFVNAARHNEYELARQYLDTRLPPAAAETLARQLFHVVDARLPARLAEISDRPEGSRSNPLTPDQEQIGEVEYRGGTLPVILDRVTRPGGARIWLFSTGTLASVPNLYAEVTTSQRLHGFPRILTERRVGGVSSRFTPTMAR